MNEKISIIIPMYNSEKTIKRCIDSCLNQTYSNIEVVIVDDGSTDNGSGIVQQERDKDNRIILVQIDNGGVSRARNTGLSHATGTYVVFVDADDELQQDGIELLQQGNQYDLVCASYIMRKVRNRKQEFIYNQKELTGAKVVEVIDCVANAPWAKLFRKSIIDNHELTFPEGIPYGEDTIFLMRYLCYTKTVLISPKVAYIYDFTDGNSAMKKYYPRFLEYCLLTMDEKRKLFRTKNVDFSIHDNSWTYYNRCISHYIKFGDWIHIGEAKKELAIDGNLWIHILVWLWKNKIDFIKYMLNKLIGSVYYS